MTAPKASVTLVIANHPVRLTRESGKYRVTGRAGSRSNKTDDDWLGGLPFRWAKVRRELAVYPIIRSSRERDLAAYAPILPGGVQYLPRTPMDVALVWDRASGDVTVRGQDGSVHSSGVWSWIVLPNLPVETGVVIDLADRKLVWDVQRTLQPPPTPPWFRQRQPTTVAQRVVRAAWIAVEGPSEWRLFALSELAALAPEDTVAEDLWTGARSGELAPISMPTHLRTSPRPAKPVRQ